MVVFDIYVIMYKVNCIVIFCYFYLVGVFKIKNIFKFKGIVSFGVVVKVSSCK